MDTHQIMAVYSLARCLSGTLEAAGAMIATTAKLRELLEAAGATPADKKYTWGNIVSAQRTLENRGPDLARLVLTLTEALEPFPMELADLGACTTPKEQARCPHGEGRCSEVRAAQEALAAVEALES